jgi:hypothetical protein
MRPVLPRESQALSISEDLLRFAAEHVKDLPESIVSDLCKAQDASLANAWDHDVATSFWCAFNSLCELVKPSTQVEGLAQDPNAAFTR